MEAITALVVGVISAMFSGFATLVTLTHKNKSNKKIDSLEQSNKEEIIVLKTEQKNVIKQLDKIDKTLSKINDKIDDLRKEK
ncbi:hypothetical protein [Mesoplasma melaleucae]|uniref:Uncharacterized protein n=1 Tax=Mesoplasma melaleucae TaxID=81459 RepID=A0A2K8NWS2_9MOLU|nr:hypothetical protein [Mesoplasma melaleucae]ATZ18295.1 hypothetical protein EMELA_v1c08080 [Mesoplasma melaleucae]